MKHSTVALGMLALVCSACGGGLAEPEQEPARLGQGTQALNGAAAGWVTQGPTAISNGQVENVPPGNIVIGALHAVAAHPTDANVLYVESVNGGLWRTQNATAASPAWQPLTDFAESLSVGALHMDPTDSARLLAGIGVYSSFGTGGSLTGLLLTTDAGNTWSAIDDPLLRRNISGVYVRGSLMLASSNAGGVFHSTDGGATWAGASGIFGAVFDLVADPSNTSRFYASGASSGIFLSTDSGANWSDVSQNDASAGGLQQTIQGGGNNNTELAVGQDGRVYAVVMLNGQAGYIGYSSDQGSSWVRMDLPRIPQTVAAAVSGASNTTPIVITTAAPHGLPLNNGTIRVRITGVLGNTNANGDFSVQTLVAGGPNNQFTLRGSSGNGNYTSGGSWQRFAHLNPREKPGGQGGIHLSVAVDPTDSSIVYVGGDRQDSPFPNFIGAANFTGNLARGDAGQGATNAIPSPQWEHLTHSNSIAQVPGGGTANSSAPHADSREMAFDANGDIIEVDDGGIYRRTSPRDNTGDWFSLNGNLAVTELHNIAYDAVSGVVFGGAQDTGNPQQTAVGSGAWNDFAQGDGGDVQVDTITTAGQSIRYTSAQNLGSFTRTVFDAAGNNLGSTAIAPTPPTGVAATPRFVTPFELNKVNAQRLVLAYQEAVFESTNQGSTIASLGTSANANGMFYGHASNEDLLYTAGPGGVFVRTTAGGALAASATFPGGTGVDVVVDPADAATAYVITAASVFMTTDSGGTWTNITGDLGVLRPGTLSQIEYIPSATVDRIVIAASRGVFVASVNTLRFWNELGREVLPNALVFDLDYEPTADLLVAGTMGRGAWSLANASTIGLPPAAVCQNIVREANDVCLGFAQADDFNGGSIDPEGEALSLSVVPVQPYVLGPTNVTLRVSDPPGALETCAARITVIDVTPPVLPVVESATRIVCDPDTESLSVAVPVATDNCSVASVTGQVILSDNATLSLPINLVDGRGVVGVGTHTIEWTALDGSGNRSTTTQVLTVTPALYVTKRAELGEKSKLVALGGTGALLGNSGDHEVRALPKAFLGEIVSASRVILKEQCEVDGDVLSLGDVFVGTSVLVGDVQSYLAQIPLPAITAVPELLLPSGPNAKVLVKRHRNVSLAPGAYASVRVESGGTLRLSSGIYAIRELQLDPHADVFIDVTLGPVYLVVTKDLYSKARFELVGGGPLDVSLIYLGKEEAWLDAFSGRLFAPKATLLLGPEGKGNFAGQLFARELVLGPRGTFECYGDGI